MAYHKPSSFCKACKAGRGISNVQCAAALIRVPRLIQVTTFYVLGNPAFECPRLAKVTTHHVLQPHHQTNVYTLQVKVGSGRAGGDVRVRAKD